MTTQPNYDKTYTLADLIQELLTSKAIYCDQATLRERFKKLMKALNQDHKAFKNENGEFFFYYDHKELMKALLLEMGEGYLQRFTSNKHVGKTISDNIPHAIAFREKMLEHMIHANVSPEGKEQWIKIIDVISRKEVYLIAEQTMTKMKASLTAVFSSASNHDELLESIQDFDEVLDEWTKKRFKNAKIKSDS